jgi:hypothetical protein
MYHIDELQKIKEIYIDSLEETDDGLIDPEFPNTKLNFKK